MSWRVEISEEFEAWWRTLIAAEQESLDAMIQVLEQRGPSLGRPYVDHIKGSKHPNMKELRVQHRGRPLRVLFAFNLRRVAVLLVGGDKSGNARWYRSQVARADRILDRHIEQLRGSRLPVQLRATED